MVLIVQKLLQGKITLTMIWVIKMVISCCSINVVCGGGGGDYGYQIDRRIQQEIH